MNENYLMEKAKVIRRTCLQSMTKAHSSHIGCVFSMVDIVTYLFYEKMDHKIDKFILSKGHAVAGLYTVLHDRGIINDEEYASYHSNDSHFIAHPNHVVNGVEVSTGSLGHGLAIASGLAWANSMDKKPGIIYCLLGDGECQEGSIWEALIFIARNLFKNLIIIIDANNYQGFSDTCDSLFSHKKLFQMLKGTALDVREINGHNFKEIQAALSEDLIAPRVLLAHTIKGKGVSYMENKFEWHYKTPDPNQLNQALDELK
ncbi:MAG: 1-deoxy-D-xylulose-5-phosphate synthase N-terminal domain-containing protein [Desulfocapsaceae bacterium]|nr:1-deoxy-D-xylulose-5-phosphate synthase N-terminal domain-containing protein [Desulfocapsaceae bacterium]